MEELIEDKSHKDIKPLELIPAGRYILTTAWFYPEDKKNKAGIIEASAGKIREYQQIVAVSDWMKENGDYKVGDIIIWSPMRYELRGNQESQGIQDNIEMHKKVQRFKFNFVEVNDTLRLQLDLSDIVYKVSNYEIIDYVEPEEIKETTNLDLVDSNGAPLNKDGSSPLILN